jgi:hypothetical protein
MLGTTTENGLRRSARIAAIPPPADTFLLPLTQPFAGTLRIRIGSAAARPDVDYASILSMSLRIVAVLLVVFVVVVEGMMSPTLHTPKS